MAKTYKVSGNKVIELKRCNYKNEEELQNLIADNPNLVAREEPSEDLYLVRKEQPIYLNSNSGFSLDLLLIDGKGVPVFCEVKRHNDTRIKREVIGQILEYAAGAKGLDVEQAEIDFRKNNPNNALDETVWMEFKNNLKQGNLRLVIAADEIPDSIIPTIDFLNDSFKSAQVYGVEIRQIKASENDTDHVIVTQCIGLRKWEEKQQENGKPVEWNRDLLLQQFKEVGEEEAVLAEKIIDWIEDHSEIESSYGRGIKSGSLTTKARNGWLFNMSYWNNTIKFETAVAEMYDRTNEDWTLEKLKAYFMELKGDAPYEYIHETPKHVMVDIRLFKDHPEKLGSYLEKIKTLNDEIVGDN